jgi:hypothetical protein
VMDVPWENLARHLGSCIKFIKEGKKCGGNVLIHG